MNNFGRFLPRWIVRKGEEIQIKHSLHEQWNFNVDPAVNGKY